MNPVYLLVDGENIDRTLGQILDNKPRPDQRPRWEKVRLFVEQKHQKTCKALFFINASRGLPGTFIQALKIAGYTPIALSGPEEVKVVDQAIIKTLGALKEKEGDVCLASHDADFFEALKGLCAQNNRDISVLAFPEYLSGDYGGLTIRVLDIEDEAKAFEGGPLPRMRVIDIDDFDPLSYL